ncbi:PilW family protein [Glaciimonas soli]|uniref:PilW family protein n=1 Tax=Glaciimonas soli TaxID=2590999 RepID=UPI001885749B|nr:PilW family protein [Glaciimonas soli]
MCLIKRDSGFTIIELMVAMVIGLVMMLFVIQLYLSISASYRLHDDNLRLHQDGRYAMQLMETNLRQAGFGNLSSTDINAALVDRTDFVDEEGNPGRGLRGCDHGYNKPMMSPPDFSCSSGTGAAAFEVAYRVSDDFDSLSGAGADCNGAKAKTYVLPATHPAYLVNKPVHIVANLFFVATPARSKIASLYCNGNGGTIAQPLLDNVENLRLLYGVAANGGSSVQQFLSAADVDALSSDQLVNWRRVVSVKLCLQIVGAKHNTTEPQHYTDCDGVDRTAKDHKLRAVLTSVTMLRNSAGSAGAGVDN